MHRRPLKDALLPCPEVGVTLLQARLFEVIAGDEESNPVPGDEGEVSVGTDELAHVTRLSFDGPSLQLVTDEILLVLEDRVEHLEHAQGLLVVAVLCAFKLFLVKLAEPDHLAKVGALLVVSNKAKERAEQARNRVCVPVLTFGSADTASGATSQAHWQSQAYAPCHSCRRCIRG